MPQLWKLLILFALISALPSPIQASPADPLYYAPSPYKDDLSPESQYPFDEEQDMAPEYQDPSPLAYAPEIEPYAENPSLSPLPLRGLYLDNQGPDAEDNEDELYYSPSEAPSLTEVKYSEASDTPVAMAPQAHALPPVLPFNYSAEDDTGEFSEDYNEEAYPEERKKIGAVIGFVIGAVCLVGLGGLVYNRRTNQKRKQHLLLSKRGVV